MDFHLTANRLINFPFILTPNSSRSIPSVLLQIFFCYWTIWKSHYDQWKNNGQQMGKTVEDDQRRFCATLEIHTHTYTYFHPLLLLSSFNIIYLNNWIEPFPFKYLFLGESEWKRTSTSIVDEANCHQLTFALNLIHIALNRTEANYYLLQNCFLKFISKQN